MDLKPLKMGYNFDRSAAELDPARIHTAYEYGLVRNLYSRLVERDQNSQLGPGVAETFQTEETSVTFEFGSRVKTVDGHVINAQDAEISLKRLIMRGRTGHGDIRRLLCPGVEIKAPSDGCPGISRDRNRLKLSVTHPHLLPLLLSTLESADYSILPADAIDPNTGDLIGSHRNTSGPYYVSKDSPTGALELKANPNHFLFSPQMPQIIQMVPVGLLEGLKLFLDGEVDLLPTTQSFNTDEAEKILRSGDYDIHETLPLKVRIIQFSYQAVIDFSPEQRRFAGRVVGNALTKLLPLVRSKATSQFFQGLSEGSLTEAQFAEIEGLRNDPARPKFSKPIEVAFNEKFAPAFRDELKDYPEIRVVVSKVPAASMPFDRRPDMYAISNDSASTEDLNLLGHNFEVGNFFLPGLNKDKWLNEYLSNTDKNHRISALNLLHYRMLKEVIFYPVSAAPYFAAIRHPWKLNQSSLSAGTRLWRIRPN